MLRRRLLTSGLCALGTWYMRKPSYGNVPAQDQSYEAFLNDIAQQAREEDIPGFVTDVAFSSLKTPNENILRANQRQVEFTISWEEYRRKTLTPIRIQNGFNAASNAADILRNVAQLYHVQGNVITAIWGMESAYGAVMGDHPVIDTLASLAYAGKRSAFFRKELMVTLHIIYNMTILPSDIVGSYAGAMGQPQFMPSVYYRLAAKYPPRKDYSDIWHNEGDVLASIANYLKAYGWNAQEKWGEQVILPSRYFSVRELATSRTPRPTSWWRDRGVSPMHGQEFSHPYGTLIQPSGAGGEAFMTYNNFKVIQQYNASDSYALSVCLLSDKISALIQESI